jgi:hypothetical protein
MASLGAMILISTISRTLLLINSHQREMLPILCGLYPEALRFDPQACPSMTSRSLINSTRLH